MEWKLRALDAEGNPIEPKQESVQEEAQEPVQENVQEQVQETVQEEKELVKETTDVVSEENIEELLSRKGQCFSRRVIRMGNS